MEQKDATISLLKKEIRMLQQGHNRSSEEDLKQLKRTHKRLKECNKEKRKKVETVSKENCMNLKKNWMQKMKWISSMRMKYVNYEKG